MTNETYTEAIHLMRCKEELKESQSDLINAGETRDWKTIIRLLADIDPAKEINLFMHVVKEIRDHYENSIKHIDEKFEKL